LGVFVEEGEERQAGPFVTELGGQRLAAGRVEGGLPLPSPERQPAEPPLLRMISYAWRGF